MTRVLLSSETDPDAVVSQQLRTRVDAVQLVDRWDAERRAALRSRLPGVRLIQVVHVTGTESVDEAREAAVRSDALLLDSGRPDGRVRELGGTGRVHDWATSRAIREAVEIPVFLAGGLTADNVRDAIRAVRPYAVDVCTGVRSDGRLDASRLQAFARAVGR
ncbi:MAG: phosphoribosylanthranilate isomerase [Gemmatimonadetes bacterium]|nr:phosphoribosylanthranilate isomerase [Gemmatimonadota bacterium]